MIIWKWKGVFLSQTTCALSSLQSFSVSILFLPSSNYNATSGGRKIKTWGSARGRSRKLCFHRPADSLLIAAIFILSPPRTSSGPTPTSYIPYHSTSSGNRKSLCLWTNLMKCDANTVFVSLSSQPDKVCCWDCLCVSLALSRKCLCHWTNLMKCGANTVFVSLSCQVANLMKFAAKTIASIFHLSRPLRPCWLTPFHPSEHFIIIMLDILIYQNLCIWILS